MQPVVKVRGKINTAHVKRRVRKGTKEALPGAGVIVQRSARRQFLHRNIKKKPQWKQVGERNGRPVLAMEFRPPTPGRVTSWKNPRGRGATKTGFLRTLIRWEVDNSRESVAIGPTNEATWLNRLQEFGGSGQRVLRLIGRYPQRGKRKNKVLEQFPPPDAMVSGGRSGGRDRQGRFKRNLGRGAFVGIWVDPAHTRRRKTVDLASSTGRVPPGQYMTKGLSKVRDRLAEQWKNRIYGP